MNVFINMFIILNGNYNEKKRLIISELASH
jgi:hypothetical protein